MNQKKPVLYAPFEGNVNDGSGLGNHGAVFGTAVYAKGYDGGRALRFENPSESRKEKAPCYVIFPGLKGIGPEGSGFSVTFWYKTGNGGLGRWATAAQKTAAGGGIRPEEAELGGVIFSARRAAGGGNAVEMLQLPQNQYTAALFAAGGQRREIDGIWEPQDSRWHHLAAVCARRDALRIYVDGKQAGEADIRTLPEESWAGTEIALGADAEGRFGLGSADVDDFSVYADALNEAEVRALYIRGRLRELIREAGERCGEKGSPNTEDERRRLREAIERAKQTAGRADADTEETEKQCAVLRAALEEYLLAPAARANLAMLLIGDVHIAEPGDARCAALEQIIGDTARLGIRLDGMIDAGDLANNARPASTQTYFDVLEGLLDRYGLSGWQLAACFGNHEISYKNEEECYLKTAPVYWANLQKHLSPLLQVRRYGKGTLDEAWGPAGEDGVRRHYCWGMTLAGYHFLILNTDYREQTGCSLGVPGPVGNALDPIRHGVLFDEETFAWLERMLERYRKDGRPVFVVCHFPFIDSVPLSYFRETVIEDNSIGRQDARIRSLLARDGRVIYFCGHLHSGLGMSGPVKVVSREGGELTEINVPSPKVIARGYRGIPSGWLMFVYDTQIILRARDFGTGEWLTEYDAVIPLA